MGALSRVLAIMECMDDNYRDFLPGDRPSVEVLIGDAWQPGELRAWHRRDGLWWANVAWTDATRSMRLDVVPSDRVRLLEE